MYQNVCSWKYSANRVRTEHEYQVVTMALDGRAVANFVLDFCETKGRGTTNLSLQKIVYFCHVWSLIELGRPLLKHKFEAWQYGPVLQYLYREFRSFEDRPITARATSIDPNTGEKRVVGYDFDDETKSLVYRIADFYSRLSASDLIRLSHVKGGPWDQVWNHQGSINPGMKMSDDLIKDFYSKVNPPFSIQ